MSTNPLLLIGGTASRNGRGIKNKTQPGLGLITGDRLVSSKDSTARPSALVRRVSEMENDLLEVIEDLVKARETGQASICGELLTVAVATRRNMQRAQLDLKRCQQDLEKARANMRDCAEIACMLRQETRRLLDGS
jgi:hypothetical protein